MGHLFFPIRFLIGVGFRFLMSDFENFGGFVIVFYVFSSLFI